MYFPCEVKYMTLFVSLNKSVEQWKEFSFGEFGWTRLLAPRFRNSDAAPSGVTAGECAIAGGEAQTRQW